MVTLAYIPGAFETSEPKTSLGNASDIFASIPIKPVPSTFTAFSSTLPFSPKSTLFPSADKLPSESLVSFLILSPVDVCLGVSSKRLSISPEISSWSAVRLSSNKLCISSEISS